MKLIFSLILILTSIQAVARQSQPLTPAPLKQMSIDFGDGRIAGIYIVEGPASENDTYKFKIASNTCSSSVDDSAALKSKLGCSLEVPAMLVGVALIWTSHPDSSKIGKTLQTKDGSILRAFSTLNTIDYMLAPFQSAKEIRAAKIGIDKSVLPRLACADYSWLPDAGKQVSIVRWSLIAPLTNPETQQIEARPLIDTFGVTLTPENGKYQFNFLRQTRQANNDYRYSGLNGILSIVPSKEYGGNSIQAHLSVQKEDGEGCEVTLQSDRYAYNASSGSKNETLKGEIPEYFEGTKKPLYHPAHIGGLKDLEKDLGLFNQMVRELGPEGIE